METRRGENTFHKCNGVKTTMIGNNIIHNQHEYTIHNLDKFKYAMHISSIPMYVVPINGYQRYLLSDYKHWIKVLQRQTEVVNLQTKVKNRQTEVEKSPDQGQKNHRTEVSF